MTIRNRAIAKRWMKKASKRELLEVMEEAMLTPLQRDIIILRRKDESILAVSLTEKFSTSKINKEIAKARESVSHALKAMGKLETI